MDVDNKVIFPDSPEAASIKTVTGWVSNNGLFFGTDERTARWDGSTHTLCKECSSIIRKGGLTICTNCKIKKNIKNYNSLPKKKWDGKSMLYSDSSGEYFCDIDSAEDSLEPGYSLESLRLLICEPSKIPVLTDDFFEAVMAEEDDDIPEYYKKIIDDFNKAALSGPIISWSPSEFALDLTIETENENNSK